MTSRVESASWRGWAGIAASAGLLLVASVHRYAIGTLAGSLMAEFGASAVEIGVLASLYFYLYGAMQVPAGVLADTLGPRRTIVASGLCLAVGAGVSAWAPDLTTAYVGRVLVGLGAAPIFINALRLLASWFDPWRFATLVGLINGSGSLGNFLAGAPLAVVVTAFGWRGTFAALSVATVAVTVIAWMLVRDRPEEPVGENRESRSATGSPGRSEHWGGRGAISGPPVLLIETRARVAPPPLRAADLAAVARNVELWKALVIKAGLDSGQFLFFAVWGAPYLRQVYGLSPAGASAYVSISIAGFAFGAPLLGMLSDRVFMSRRIPLVLSTSGYTLLWSVLLFPPRGAWGPALMALATFAVGFLGSCLLLTLSVARDTAPASTAGVATALVNAGGFLSAGMFQVGASAIMDLLWTGETAAGVRVYPLHAFQAAFACSVVAAIVSVVTSLRLREGRHAGAPPA